MFFLHATQFFHELMSTMKLFQNLIYRKLQKYTAEVCYFPNIGNTLMESYNFPHISTFGKLYMQIFSFLNFHVVNYERYKFPQKIHISFQKIGYPLGLDSHHGIVSILVAISQKIFVNLDSLSVG